MPAAGVNPPPAATLEAERDDLAGRRERLVARLATAKTAADRAVDVCRELLTAPEIDETKLAVAERARNEAFGTRDGTELAIGDVTKRLAAVEAAIVERDARIERERAAAEQADRIDELADTMEDVEAATRALAEAYQRFRVAAYATVQRSTANPIGAELMIGEVRSQILAAAFPDNFVPSLLSQTVSLRNAMSVAISGLRNEIAGIRAGTIVPLHQPVAYVPPPTFPEVAIALHRVAFYQTALGQRIDLQPGGCVVPEPIAAEAIRQEVGFGAETQDGKRIVAIIKAQPGAVIQRGQDGLFYAKKHTGIFEGFGRRTKEDVTAPAADLGMMPAAADLAEAAQ